MKDFKVTDIWFVTWLSIRGVEFNKHSILKGTKLLFEYRMTEDEWRTLRKEFSMDRPLSRFRAELQKIKDLAY